MVARMVLFVIRLNASIRCDALPDIVGLLHSIIQVNISKVKRQIPAEWRRPSPPERQNRAKAIKHNRTLSGCALSFMIRLLDQDPSLEAGGEGFYSIWRAILIPKNNNFPPPFRDCFVPTAKIALPDQCWNAREFLPDPLADLPYRCLG